MALDYDALIEIGEELAKRGGDAKYFSQKEIGAETSVRLMPPTPAMNGKYFVEERGYWIAQKKYVTGETFGGPDPLAEEIAAAKAMKNPQIDALLGNWKAFSKSSNFIVPILLLDIEYKGQTPVSVDVVDECVKYASFGKQLIQAINALVTNRHYMTGELGLLDRVTGRNLCLSKTGKDKETKYSAIVEPVEMTMPEDYYEDYACPVEMVEKSLVDDEIVVAAFRNYLYGEPMPEVANRPAAPVAAPKAPLVAKPTAAPIVAPVVGKKKMSIKDMMADD